MPIFTAIQGSLTVPSLLSQLFSANDASSSLLAYHSCHFTCSKILHKSRHSFSTLKVSVSENPNQSITTTTAFSTGVFEASPDAIRQARRSADWKAARAYIDSGSIFEGRIEGSNNGGLLIRFFSLMGFLPFPQLSPSHSCKEPEKTIQEIAKGLIGSRISVKGPDCKSRKINLIKKWGCRSRIEIILNDPLVIQAEEENRKLIFSEREASWSKFSKRINVGDIFAGRVGTVEDYGAFVHLLLPDGLYHLTGLVHVSEVSWDLVRDVRDILSEGDEVKVKVINIDWQKSRITLSIKQLEEDPLLETLDKVIPQDGSIDHEPSTMNSSSAIEPLPGLEAIIQELLVEEGVDTVRINRQGFEKRVVSQDLQLWLSNAPPVDRKFILLARAGRQVQEIQLTTTLDQEGIKKALQRVLERVP